MKRLFTRTILSLLIALSGCGVAVAKTFKVTSPDGAITLAVDFSKGICTYSVTNGGEALISSSALGINTSEGAFETLRLLDNSRDTFYEEWHPHWGHHNTAINHYNELTLNFADAAAESRTIDYIFRVFDDGVAIRYHLPKQAQKSWTIVGEKTEYDFVATVEGYVPNSEDMPKGPLPLSRMVRTRTPFVINNIPGSVVALHEANLTDYAYINLDVNERGVLSIVTEECEVNDDFSLPWRTIQIGDNVGELLLSDLLQNLNPPCDDEEFAWVKSGNSMNECRVWGAKLEDGYQYGKSMSTFKRFIDFAQKSGLSYVMVDSGWYGEQWSVNSHPLTPRQADDNIGAQKFYGGTVEDMNKLRDPIEMKELIDYAKERGVGMFIYINDLVRTANSMEFLESVLKTYSEWGAAGVKYGFMKEKAVQAKVKYSREIVKICAKYKLMVDFHDGPIPPTGESRTYPNYVSREYGHGQFDGKKTFIPTAFLRMLFVNSLAGPIDYQNGFFNLETDVDDRFQVWQKELYSTACAEAARVVLSSNGLTVISDHDNAYERKSDLFEVIAACKGAWDKSVVLAAELGEVAAIARQSGDKWYVGVNVCERGGYVELPMDFLESGKTYKATVFTDGAKTTFTRNREEYQVNVIEVTSDDVLGYDVACGGGVCIILE